MTEQDEFNTAFEAVASAISKSRTRWSVFLAGRTNAHREDFLIRELARRLTLDGWHVHGELLGYSPVELPRATQTRPDLVAVKEDRVALVEVKASNASRETHRVRRLRQLASEINADLIVINATNPRSLTIDRRATVLAERPKRLGGGERGSNPL